MTMSQRLLLPAAALAVLACADQPQVQTGIRPDSAVATHTPADTSMVATCDSVTQWVRNALRLDIRREDGDFRDRWHNTPRSGCRLSARGSFNTFADEAGPVGALDQAFRRQGWRSDLMFSADGPDGSVIGMRSRQRLCVVYGSWQGHDDSDTTTVTADQDPEFDVALECSRDVVNNANLDVPDEIWSVAHAAGNDSVYAISATLQYPPYIDGDFDGDAVADAAVLIERRATGEYGVAIVHRGTSRVTILGAGNPPGPRDLVGIESWEVFPKDAAAHLTIGDRPRASLAGDALWVQLGRAGSGFYIWTGSSFIYEAH